MRLVLRLALALSALAGSVVGLPARAEQCPSNQPGWMRGRTLVFEENLSPAAERPVGEIFVYAFIPGESISGTRFMAVSDADGWFCIHDTVPGSWVVTAWEPFTFRPFVKTIICTAASCDLGNLALDGSLLRISDDYVNYDNGWWGGPFAQTLVMPAGASSWVKLAMRSGGESRNDIQVHSGQSITGAPLASSSLHFPNGGGRATAVFRPGEVAVKGGDLLTVVLGGGSGPWRLANDAYPAGQMFLAGGGTLVPIAGNDLCLTLDLDGIDGTLTSHFETHDGSIEYANVAAQSFVARTPEISHASLVVGQPAGFRRVQASIGETPDGPAIGPVKETIGLEEQGVAFAWFPGEVPVTVGKTYWVRFRFPTGGHAVYKRTLDPLGHKLPGGQLWVDGNLVDGALGGRVLGPVPPSPVADGGAVTADAGGADATTAADAGTTDAAAIGDAGAATPDGGAGGGADAGSPGPGKGSTGGCSCGLGGAGFLALLFAAAARRRR